MKLTAEQSEILEYLRIGVANPGTFKGRGYIVAGMVRRGWCEWLRQRPNSTVATGLRITDLGRVALSAETNRDESEG